MSTLTGSYTTKIATCLYSPELMDDIIPDLDPAGMGCALNVLSMDDVLNYLDVFPVGTEVEITEHLDDGHLYKITFNPNDENNMMYYYYNEQYTTNVINKYLIKK